MGFLTPRAMRGTAIFLQPWLRSKLLADAPEYQNQRPDTLKKDDFFSYILYDK